MIWLGWNEAHKRFNEHGHKSIRGPIGNIISILPEYGWNPRTYNIWDTHDGETSYILNELNCSPNAIVDNFSYHVNETDANRAQIHYCGEGMAGGIDWVTSLAWHRSSHTEFSQKNALETIHCGAFWINCRVHSFSPHVSPICNRCTGNCLDTPLHCFWSCPANANLTDDAVVKTQGL